MRERRIFLIFPLVLFIILTAIFYWKTFAKGMSPFPGDMLIGSYYPWLNQKWGYTVGVPVKNPLISDVYSVNYIEKSLIAESLSKFKIPLWNPYSYSGTPLLANFHSGVFNPFNFLMVIFDHVKGWNYLIISQTLGSLITMYLFLRTLKRSVLASVIGSVIYAFSGFSIVWLLYATTGYALLWLPLIFLFIEKFFQYNKYSYLTPLPLLLFLLMSAGHIQLFCFGFLIGCSYFVWKLFTNKTNNPAKPLIFFTIICIIGIGLMSIQLLPTLDLSQKSIRSGENFIESVNYGLQPLGKLTTLFSPDFFGNPTTYNYWGFFDYNETILYVSIFGLMSLIYCLFCFTKLKNDKFFVFFSVFSVLLVTNNPIGKLIYLLKVPALSTSAAGRITIILTFCIAVLSSLFIDKFKTIKFKDFVRYFWGLYVFALSLFLIIFITRFIFNSYGEFNQNLLNNLNISFRNLILPCLFLVSISLSIFIFKNKTISKLLILIIIIADLFRFGWKYTPFIDSKLVYPSTPLINFLQQQPGLFRIEKERGALLPPNTWAAYRLSSTSGYEPLALDRYATYYNQYINFALPGSNNSRYSELDYFDAERLGQSNVKYLVAFKYDNNYEISPDGKFLNPKINLKDWNKVFEEDNIVLLENLKYKPRIFLLDTTNASSKLETVEYQPNNIKLSYKSDKITEIVLLDSWESGWKAKVNSQITPLKIFNDTFKSVPVPMGEGSVEFYYYPDSFHIGKNITYVFSIAYLILIMSLVIKKKK